MKRYRACPLHQSSLTPDFLTNLAYFSISDLKKTAAASGDEIAI
jgi:hypothetical protein